MSRCPGVTVERQVPVELKKLSRERGDKGVARSNDLEALALTAGIDRLAPPVLRV